CSTRSSCRPCRWSRPRSTSSRCCARTGTCWSSRSTASRTSRTRGRCRASWAIRTTPRTSRWPDMRILRIAILTVALLSTSCSSDSLKHLGNLAKGSSKAPEVAAPRLVMFIGVDISGSFMNGRYFDDSIAFLARYIHGHLNGLGEMEVPHSLFVGSIGGATKDQAKTLYPIEAFQNRSLEQMEQRLHEIFPKGRVNTYTDFNAFFTQVGDMIDQKKLLLKPISIVLLTDGDPDMGDASASTDKDAKFRKLSVSPLEGLSRNITVR